MKQACFCAAWLAMFQTCSVSAQDAGVYVSAAIGLLDAPDESQLGLTPPLTGRTKNDEVSWNVGVGYRFNPNIALELGYVDLGKIEADLTDASGATDSSAHASFAADGATLALVGAASESASNSVFNRIFERYSANQDMAALWHEEVVSAAFNLSAR